LAQKPASKNTAKPQEKALGREIRGLLHLFAATVLGIILLSYHPNDPLLWNEAAGSVKPQNLFGVVGAHLAGCGVLLLGFSSLWLVVVFLALGILSFRGKAVTSPIRTSIAVLLLVCSFSAILSLQWPDEVSYRGGKIMTGGLVGLHLAEWTKVILNEFGALALFGSIFAITLLVVTRLSLGSIASRVTSWVTAIARRVRETLRKRRERRKRIQKTAQARKRPRPRRKVNIVEPARQPPKKPRQQNFAFMKSAGEFVFPSLDLLEDPPDREDRNIQRESLEMNARRLEKKLSDFGVNGEVMEILPGPVITMYEFKPAPGVKISKVASLADDLALALRAPSIRIVAPIPGKAAIGIEIPNNQREMVTLKEVLSSEAFTESNFKLPIALGKDITGAPVVTDLTRMPHLLVAGATGTGKSVSINTMITSLLFSSAPDKVRFVMVDPKRIELSIYNDIPHLLHPVVTNPKEANRALHWAVEEMERRYMLLSDRGVRNVESYNRKVAKIRKSAQQEAEEGRDRPLPYIILVIDELADLMMVSSKEVEESITRLAQMARAAGIHLIIATQRPSVDVLTGIIKANFPTRISFQVSSRVDSRTILDTVGAEHLLGDGDMLFMPPGVGRITRIHGPFVSEEEIKAITDFLRSQRKPDYDPSIVMEVNKEDETFAGDEEADEKYEDAVAVVLRTGQASISMLQRKLRVGYNRAARMIEMMEQEGIVGPSDGVKPREVYGRKGD